MHRRNKHPAQSHAQRSQISKAGVITTDLMLLEGSPRTLIGQLARERSHVDKDEIARELRRLARESFDPPEPS